MLHKEPLRVEHPADGQVFTFDAGGVSLAFVITGAPDATESFEVLREPADLARWAEEVLGAGEVRVSRTDLVAARRLRTAIGRIAGAVVDGRQPDSRDRRVLNRAAARRPLTPRLRANGKPGWSGPARAPALLSSVARDAIDLIGGPRAQRLKRCEGVNCSILFVDTSRPGTRRWCSMDRCGNRAKARAHYQRARDIGA